LPPATPWSGAGQIRRDLGQYRGRVEPAGDPGGGVAAAGVSHPPAGVANGITYIPDPASFGPISWSAIIRVGRGNTSEFLRDQLGAVFRCCPIGQGGQCAGHLEGQCLGQAEHLPGPVRGPVAGQPDLGSNSTPDLVGVEPAPGPGGCGLPVGQPVGEQAGGETGLRGGACAFELFQHRDPVDALRVDSAPSRICRCRIQVTTQAGHHARELGHRDAGGQQDWIHRAIA